MNYYERHLGDYAKDTAHLCALEIGIYDLLLDRYYATESPIKPADAYRVARARTPDEKAATDAVLAEFFHLQVDGWVQARAEAEIAKYRERSNKATASATARWAHRDGNANAQEIDANAMRTHSEGTEKGCERNASHKPLATSHQDQPHGPAAPSRFDEFWSAYPKKVDKSEARKAWKSRQLDAKADVLIADVLRRKREHRAWLEGYVPHASTYIRGARWEDEIEAPRSKGAAELPKETL